MPEYQPDSCGHWKHCHSREGGNPDRRSQLSDDFGSHVDTQVLLVRHGGNSNSSLTVRRWRAASSAGVRNASRRQSHAIRPSAFLCNRPAGGRCGPIFRTVDNQKNRSTTTVHRSLQRKSCMRVLARAPAAIAQAAPGVRIVSTGGHGVARASSRPRASAH